MDKRLTVKVGDAVRTADGRRGYVAVISFGGMRVTVTTDVDGGWLVGEYHPTKVWAVLS